MNYLMKKLLLFIPLIFLTMGCLRDLSPRKNSGGIYMYPGRVYPEQICNEINSQGNLMELMGTIHQNVEEALKLLERPNHSTRARISDLADVISILSEKVTHLAKPEWTAMAMDYYLTWHFDNLDFNFTSGFKNMKIHSVYYAGKKRDDLIERFSFLNEDYKADVFYRGQMSYLDYCQLHKSMVVVMEVTLKKAFGISDKVYIRLKLNE